MGVTALLHRGLQGIPTAFRTRHRKPLDEFCYLAHTECISVPFSIAGQPERV